MTEREDLTKVHVELPNHWATGGESMWAARVGPDLYALRNTPFHAYDLNWGDVVFAIPDGPDARLIVRRVVRRSGHATLRVYFEEHVSAQQALELLAELGPLGASYEGKNGYYFALHLMPEASVDAVRDILDGWRARGSSDYETCEARVDGSFDDAPEGDGEDG